MFQFKTLALFMLCMNLASVQSAATVPVSSNTVSPTRQELIEQFLALDIIKKLIDIALDDNFMRKIAKIIEAQQDQVLKTKLQELKNLAEQYASLQSQFTDLVTQRKREQNQERISAMTEQTQRIAAQMTQLKAGIVLAMIDLTEGTEVLTWVIKWVSICKLSIGQMEWQGTDVVEPDDMFLGECYFNLLSIFLTGLEIKDLDTDKKSKVNNMCDKVFQTRQTRRNESLQSQQDNPQGPQDVSESKELLFKVAHFLAAYNYWLQPTPTKIFDSAIALFQKHSLYDTLIDFLHDIWRADRSMGDIFQSMLTILLEKEKGQILIYRSHGLADLALCFKASQKRAEYDAYLTKLKDARTIKIDHVDIYLSQEPVFQEWSTLVNPLRIGQYLNRVAKAETDYVRLR